MIKSLILVIVAIVTTISFGLVHLNANSRTFTALQGTSRGRVKNLIRTIQGEPVVHNRRKDAPRSKTGSTNSDTKSIMTQGKPSSKPDIVGANQLTITGGSCKGARLQSPPVYLRPMMAKVREALFSSLNSMGLFDGGDIRVLDVFAGSGSVGLEALSRGASHATFVDLSADCTKTCLTNAATCGFSQKVSVVTASAIDALLHPDRYGLYGPYALLSLTPPYQEVSYSELLDAACSSPLSGENTVLVMEYPKEMAALPYVLGGDKYFGMRCRRYGRTVLATYVYRPSLRFDLRPHEFI